LEESVEEINLDVLPIDSERMLKELSEGKMVVARAKNDFLYMIEFEEAFHLFSHSIGAPSGGQKQFPKDEKNTAIINKIAELSDSMFVVGFDENHDTYSVMYTAEEAILSMFPGEDRDNDEMVDFMDFNLPEE